MIEPRRFGLAAGHEAAANGAAGLSVGEEEIPGAGQVPGTDCLTEPVAGPIGAGIVCERGQGGPEAGREVRGEAVTVAAALLIALWKRRSASSREIISRGKRARVP